MFASALHPLGRDRPHARVQINLRPCRELYFVGARGRQDQQFEGKLREGNILMCVHAKDAVEAAKARKIFTEEKAESISTGSEAAVPAR